MTISSAILFHPFHLRSVSPQFNTNSLTALIRLDPHLIKSNSTVHVSIHHLPCHAVHRLDQAVRIFGIRVVDHSIVLPSLSTVVVLAYKLGRVESHVRVHRSANGGEEGVNDVGGVGDEGGDFEAWE